LQQTFLTGALQKVKRNVNNGKTASPNFRHIDIPVEIGDVQFPE
jgi:hypothetical protein